jgi:hypothetical protein
VPRSNQESKYSRLKISISVCKNLLAVLLTDTLSILMTRVQIHSGPLGARPFDLHTEQFETHSDMDISSHSNASFATATSGLRMNTGQRLSMNSPFMESGYNERRSQARPATTQSASFMGNRAPMHSQQVPMRHNPQIPIPGAGSRQPYSRPSTKSSTQNPYQRPSGHPAAMRPGTAQESVRSAGQSASGGNHSRPSYLLNTSYRRPSTSTSAARQPPPPMSRPGPYQSESRFSRFI